MNKLELSFQLIELKKQIDTITKSMTTENCICEHGEEASSSCSKTLSKWECFHCGATQKIIYCQNNQMLYDCPYCGQHLT